MSFKDFTRYFTKAEFCHLGPASGSFGSQTILEKRKRRWEMTQEEGEWVKYATAGGCRNYRGIRKPSGFLDKQLPEGRHTRVFSGYDSSERSAATHILAIDKGFE
ncbi:hypothetical protein X801_04695 [Opisthorchis viverrini]|uniref:Uncharacterized protein n=1 Tax=Opisthorchis viverrini TaxID=6198 RepID=A0A1S8WY34_OPIVI|nr:hypothetical protein X801_04695 [Opisthorchis viverrini]